MGFSKQKNKKVVYFVLSFLMTIIIFAILLGSGRINYGETVEVYTNTNAYSIFSNRILNIDSNDEIRQDFISTRDNLYSFSLKFYKEQFQDELIYEISLYDIDTNKLIQEWEEDGSRIGEDGFREFVLEKKIEEAGNKEFYLILKCNKENSAIYCSENDSVLGADSFLNGDVQTGDIILQISTEKNVKITLVYGFAVSLLFSLFCCGIFFYGLGNYFLHILKTLKQNIINYRRQYFRDGLFIVVIFLFSIIVEKVLSAIHFLPHNTIGAFNEYRFLFVLIFLLCVFAFVRLNKQLANKPEKVFLVIALLIGTLFVMVMPAETEVSWDESIHYWNAVSLSHSLTGKVNIAESWIYWRSGTGFQLPGSIENLRLLQNEIQNMYNSGILVSGNTNSLSGIAIISYIPSAIGLVLGRALHLPYFLTFHLGAGMNMLFYITVLYFALKKLKSGKMILISVATIATPFFLASVYSYDTWIMALSILSFSYFIGIMQSQKLVTNKDIIIMLMSLAVGIMPKAVYFPLFLMFLFIPDKQFNNKKQCYYFKISAIAFFVTFALESVLTNLLLLLPMFIVSWCTVYIIFRISLKISCKARITLAISGGVILIIVGIIAVYNFLPLVVGGGDLRGGSEVNAAEQVFYILRNPVQYLIILLRFLKNQYLAFDGNWGQIFGMFGYIGQAPCKAVPFVLLWIVAFTDKRRADLWERYNYAKIGMLLFCSVIMLLIPTALYISFTPVAYETVLGCQIRYIAPILFPFFGMIGSNKIYNNMSGRVYNGLVIASVSGILLIDIWKVVIQFYS